jgi:hypothetical protein
MWSEFSVIRDRLCPNHLELPSSCSPVSQVPRPFVRICNGFLSQEVGTLLRNQNVRRRLHNSLRLFCVTTLYHVCLRSILILSHQRLRSSPSRVSPNLRCKYLPRPRPLSNNFFCLFLLVNMKYGYRHLDNDKC